MLIVKLGLAALAVGGFLCLIDVTYGVIALMGASLVARDQR